jgi:hypothetical protein
MTRWCYETIKALAQDTPGMKVSDLLAMAEKNDPFYVGRPAEVEAARWFADLWERSGLTNGHLRGLHYWAVSQREPVRMPREVTCKRKDTDERFKTSIYTNFDGCWCYLADASKHARYLGLVNFADFEDHKNPDPLIFADYFWWDWDEPGCGIDLPPLAEPKIRTYGFHPVNAQPYHCEVWCEKTGANSELSPVCERYHANLVPFLGQVSITSVLVGLMERLRDSRDKPVRVFYVSDLDPAGVSMPVAMARKIEWYIRTHAPEHDIRVRSLALTPEQVRHYDLPQWFEDGRTELDALTALHPGALGQIVGDALEWYYDREAASLVRQREADLQQAVRRAVSEITSKYEPQIKALDAMREELRALEIDASEYRCEVGQPYADEDGDWLFDSRRSYRDQLAYYKAHQAAGNGR